MRSQGQGGHMEKSNVSVCPSMILFTLLCCSGCAFGNISLDMPHGVGISISVSTKDRYEVVVSEIIDARQQRQRIGMKKNGYNMDTADVLAKEDVPSWMTSLLTNHLRFAGIKVINRPSAGAQPIIVGSNLEVLFIEPVMGWFTVSTEADIGLTVNVQTPQGLTASRRYYVKGVNEEMVGDLEANYLNALNKASTELMERLVSDLIDLFRRVRNEVPNS